MLNQNRINQIVVATSWIIIFSTVAYLIFAITKGGTVPIVQIFFAFLILIYILFSIVRTKLIIPTLTKVLVFIQILLVLTWGNLIPYIHFIPFVITHLFLVEKKVKYIDSYLLFLIFCTLLELIGVLPILELTSIEIGTANLTLVLVLQVITFTIWSHALKLSFHLDNLNLLGLEQLTTSISKNFLYNTFLKGLYVSILLHFFNNFLHRTIWKAKNTKTQLSILKLFSESSRIEEKNITIKHLFSLLNVYVTDLPVIYITIHKAQTLLIILYNIQNNYISKNHNYKIEVRMIDRTIHVTFISKEMIDKVNIDFWSRNLGTMRQFLKLTNQGILDIDFSKNTMTKLSFVIE